MLWQGDPLEPVGFGFRVRMSIVFIPYRSPTETERTLAELDHAGREHERRKSGSAERTLVRCDMYYADFRREFALCRFVPAMPNGDGRIFVGKSS